MPQGSLRYTDHAALSTLEVGPRRATYLDTGPRDGVPVLLLHGVGFDRAGLSWEKTIPALTRTRRVIAPDLPGYGDSEGFGRPHTVADLGRWTASFLQALKIARADVTGVSMGGAMALWLAIHRPHLVDRLVPVGAYGLARRLPLQPLAWAVTRLPLMRLSYAAAARSPRLARLGLALAYAEPRRITADTVADVMAISRQQAAEPAFAHFQTAEVGPTRLTTCLMDDLPRIAAPTLFIHGRHDRLVPVAAARAATARVPGARLELLDSGHWPMREAPVAFDAALTSFLDGASPG